MVVHVPSNHHGVNSTAISAQQLIFQLYLRRGNSFRRGTPSKYQNNPRLSQRSPNALKVDYQIGELITNRITAEERTRRVFSIHRIRKNIAVPTTISRSYTENSQSDNTSCAGSAELSYRAILRDGVGLEVTDSGRVPNLASSSSRDLPLVSGAKGVHRGRVTRHARSARKGKFQVADRPGRCNNQVRRDFD